MNEARVLYLASFVKDELNTQEDIDVVLSALQKKTCKMGYSEETYCRKCPWNYIGLCRTVGSYIKACEESKWIEENNNERS